MPMRPCRWGLLLLTATVFLRGAPAGAGSWWQAAETGDATALAQVLGNPAAWSIGDPTPRAGAWTTTVVNGRTVLGAASGRGVRLIGATRYGAGTELVAVYRHAPAAGATATFRLSLPGEEPPGAAAQSPWVSSSARGGDGTIQFSAYDPVRAAAGTYPPFATEYLRLNGVGDRSLGWPEPLRRIVEHESASLAPLADSWLTVRLRLLPGGGYAVWVNDRLVLEQRQPGSAVGGAVQLELSPGTELASFSARRTADDNPRFEPVRLGGYVNARDLNGSAVAAGSLPPPDARVLVEDVPFEFPGSDARGRDHLDIGASWFQGCNLQGHLDPLVGPFGGRWAGAFSMNPARIRLQVPNRRYRAIHLIAAADDGENSVPVITAQFYTPGAGAPVNASATVPLFSAVSTSAVPLAVSLEGGRRGRLYHVVIPIDPGALAQFGNQKTLSIELTKEVQLYRAYPDPSYYSFHAAGLPSSVHVYALTLEAPRVALEAAPDAYGHIWTAPQKPSYTLTVRNASPAARQVRLDIATRSFDGVEATDQTRTVTVAARGTAAVTVPLTLTRHGYHDVVATLTDGDQAWTETMSLAWLHADTRERGGWEPGRGPCFGFWCWGGSHGTPSLEKETLVAALAGAETFGGSYQGVTNTVLELAARYGMVSLKHFGAGDHYVTAGLADGLTKTTEAAAVAAFVEGLKKTETFPSPTTKPRYLSFYPEPHLGHVTSGSLPDYYGEPPYQFTEDEEKRFQYFLRGLLVGAPVVKQHWPNCLNLLPHGDPMFTAVFVRKSPEARKWIDGVAVDIPVFERLPEQQTHQVALHRLWQCLEECRRGGVTNLALPMYEGPCLPSRPGALTEREFADNLARCVLILNAYGVNELCGSWGVFECSGYWGEQHYGGGVMHRMPLERPKPAYAAHATVTRHLNRRNFTRWFPTGSLSVYAVEYRHYKTGQPTHVLWTVRGRRPVSIAVPPGTKAMLYDLMDNAMELKEAGGVLSFSIDSSPCFLEGVTNDLRLALGAPDHSDAAPAPGALRLGNLGDGSWTQSTAEDEDYANNSFHQIRRFPGIMSARAEKAPDAQGGKALAVHLGEQPVARVIMPYYTTLVPRRPVEIPGKASHLGVWVRAASDWGRVVYSLVDARGERWISVGTRDEWNCDDTHGWSAFCFDGWRYLRFELPAHSPYDSFREAGTTWWGSFGRGDGIVDLPLRLEKIMVERRTHAMYVNDPQPARSDDVCLADLYAEYARPSDREPGTARLAALRRPVPAGVPELGNPIAALAATGTGAAPAITGITLPEQQADGTRCYVHFARVAGATAYEVWASPYESGQGALQLAKGWTEPGKLVGGLRPDTDFYLFLVWTGPDGKPSKPSAPFKIRLKDIFGMK